MSSVSEIKAADLVLRQDGKCTGRMLELVGGLVTIQGSVLPPLGARSRKTMKLAPEEQVWEGMSWYLWRLHMKCQKILNCC